jgi:hypothetical protein
MHHFSYTSLKIIQDEKIQAALAQQRLDAGQAVHRQGLLQMFKKFLARFINYPAGSKQEPLSDCAETTSSLVPATSSRSPE